MLVCECVCVRWCVPGAWTRSSLGIYVEARGQAQVPFALPFDTTSLIGTWGSPKRLCWPAKEFLEILLHSPSPNSDIMGIRHCVQLCTWVPWSKTGPHACIASMLRNELSLQPYCFVSQRSHCLFHKVWSTAVKQGEVELKFPWSTGFQTVCL